MRPHEPDVELGAVRVSVLMCSFNAESFIREAIDSILHQTYQAWELVVVDDGSTDRTMEIVQQYQDPRVKVIGMGRNKGIPSALNRGLEEVQGTYVARLDADDLAHPTRLERQVDFLDQHPGVVVVASRMNALGLGPRPLLGSSRSTNVGPFLLRGNQVLSSSAMFRKCPKPGLALRYREDLPNAQDYEFWLQHSQFGEIRILQEALGDYRFHLSQETSRNQRRQRKLALTIQKSALRKDYRIVGRNKRDTFFGYALFAKHALGLSLTYVRSRRT